MILLLLALVRTVELFVAEGEAAGICEAGTVTGPSMISHALSGILDASDRYTIRVGTGAAVWEDSGDGNRASIRNPYARYGTTTGSPGVMLGVSGGVG